MIVGFEIEPNQCSLDRPRTRKKSQVAARIILAKQSKGEITIDCRTCGEVPLPNKFQLFSYEQKTREQILPDTDLIIYSQKMVIGQQRESRREAILLKLASVGNKKLTMYLRP